MIVNRLLCFYRFIREMKSKRSKLINKLNCPEARSDIEPNRTERPCDVFGTEIKPKSSIEKNNRNLFKM